MIRKAINEEGMLRDTPRKPICRLPENVFQEKRPLA